MIMMIDIATRLVYEAVVQRGVAEILEAMIEDNKFYSEVAKTQEEKTRSTRHLTEEQLAQCINNHYDFNEFGGFCDDNVGEALDYIFKEDTEKRFRFINKAQEEMLCKASDMLVTMIH